jgi:cobalamin biosynthesis protein CobC
LQSARLTIVGGTLLFRLAEIADASTLFRQLGQAGILVRSFDYRSDWLRFGIPACENEWRRLAEALHHASVKP